ncbi:MAG: aminodeoxychorismate synthase component I [Cyclobacteriaceae bacterium]|nr:MAG: aminodeoxychorismate synthase component I [Cyclobacteriaceae bacterium]
MSKSGFELINELTRKNTPFLCLIDFKGESPMVYTLENIDPANLKYNINGISNVKALQETPKLTHWEKQPVDQHRYRKAFDLVQRHLHYGDTFLLNLTFPTLLKTNLDLDQIFHLSQARYKIWVKDRFVTFSPEPFIKIENGVISSYPMKGTIRTSEPDAANVILNNRKESEEHLTIVDLIRNDLAMVAEDICVDRFRYLEKIRTTQSDLLQVSSKITGKVKPEFFPNLGDLLQRLLPAGSISGAPKKKTTEIIMSAEGYERGYFSGIVGLFDGNKFDSGVMIRFIEQTPQGLSYKSGGGITVNSDWKQEYQEMIDKVYVPIV